MELEWMKDGKGSVDMKEKGLAKDHHRLALRSEQK